MALSSFTKTDVAEFREGRESRIDDAEASSHGAQTMHGDYQDPTGLAVCLGRDLKAGRRQMLLIRDSGVRMADDAGAGLKIDDQTNQRLLDPQAKNDLQGTLDRCFLVIILNIIHGDGGNLKWMPRELKVPPQNQTSAQPSWNPMSASIFPSKAVHGQLYI